jgi:hypothetical protein
MPSSATRKYRLRSAKLSRKQERRLPEIEKRATKLILSTLIKMTQN